MQIQSYFVSDPGGNDLPPTYETMSAAQDEADTLNKELIEEREAKGQCTILTASHVVGAHLADGTSTFEIG